MSVAPVLALLTGLAFEAPVTNTINGIGPLGNIKPWVCIEKDGQKGNVTLALAPGQSGNANKASGNLYYAGASLRLDGCDGNKNAYLGWLNLGFSATGINSLTFEAPNESKPTENSLQINSNGQIIGSVIYPENYKALEPNLDMKVNPITPAKNWEFTGINLSGLEFGKIPQPSVVPNLSKDDLADTQAFIKAGMNTVRVPISWGYLQHQINGPLNLEYYNKLVKPTLQSLTNAKINTIVDLHAYMRYSKYGEQYSGYNPETKVVPDGQLITDVEAYKSVWGQLAKLILEDPSINKDYILFDLMNEPANMEGHEDKVFDVQAQLINLLRGKEIQFNGYLLVEGNYWSGLHSWTTQGREEKKDNATLFLEAMKKHQVTDLSKVLINVHQYLDNDYSGTHDECLQDINTTGPNGFNLHAFSQWLKENQLKAIVTEFGTGLNGASCTKPLQDFMAYLHRNSASGTNFGFVGWTIWSTGHAWGDYNLRVKPNSYQMDVLKQNL